MISTSQLNLRYGNRILFEDVNLKFAPGNCYGIIGANGSGKSTFLKILAEEISDHSGEVIKNPDDRIAVLKQDHFEFDEYNVLKTVVMGHRRLYEIMEERDAVYARENFSDEDGIRASELEAEYADLNGWEAQAEAAALLSGLGIEEAQQGRLMSELNDSEKVRVLLAQALFGNPDILLLDEPTNHLDVESRLWLEDFLYDFKNTVLVVSHDRHFLNKICTHVVDIDYSRMQMYVGNYDFWYHSSQLALKQKKDENKKREDKIKELREFIQRFSSNASKARQATARKKQVDKLTPEDIKPSNRKYPYINFKSEREAGNDILNVEGLRKSVNGERLLNNISFRINRGDKIALVGENPLARSALFQILMGEQEPDDGSLKWGITTSRAYFPREYDELFENDLTLIDWLRQYSAEQEEGFIRGFLGRMLFSGDEATKKARVLSGGEKVRCMFSRMMLSGANVLIFDEPTNHLDLEAITALNNGMSEFSGTVLFTSHDFQLNQTVANRVFEITDEGIVDRLTTFEEYLEMKRRDRVAV